MSVFNKIWWETGITILILVCGQKKVTPFEWGIDTEGNCLRVWRVKQKKTKAAVTVTFEIQPHPSPFAPQHLLCSVSDTLNDE